MLELLSRSPNGAYNDPNAVTRPDTLSEQLPRMRARNHRFPAVSDCVRFRHEPGRGRFAVAARDVSVGEFVCVERPLVSRILPDYAASNCANCFRSMKAPMPCPACTKVMFCSYQCRYYVLIKTTYFHHEHRGL